MHYHTTLIKLKAFILLMLHLNQYPPIVGVPENVNKVCLKPVKANKMSRWDESHSVNTHKRMEVGIV